MFIFIFKYRYIFIIDLQNRVIRSDLDIIMNGMVTWVGRSSAEVTMHLMQKYGDDDLK